jgi:hypothetical protein
VLVDPVRLMDRIFGVNLNLFLCERARFFPARIGGFVRPPPTRKGQHPARQGLPFMPDPEAQCIDRYPADSSAQRFDKIASAARPREKSAEANLSSRT